MKTMKLFLILISLSFFLGCSTNNDSKENPTIPVLTTTAVSSITENGAISGGAISSDGGEVISARGIVWSTSPEPTIALPTKTSDGIGSATFISTITGLTPNTIYYITAYATNSVGTTYGNEVSFTTTTVTNVCGTVTDIDSNTYNSVTIGTQCWTQTNLNVSKYRNGDIIPQVTDPTAWSNLTTGAWCYFDNSTANGPVYGKLYNWYAVNDPRGLAPSGWHIPSDDEWTVLTTYLGGVSVAGGKMKEMGTTHWISPNTAADNSSGFTALPGESRSLSGSFYLIGERSFFWSSTDGSSGGVWIRMLSNDNGNAPRSYSNGMKLGFSVRCVKD